MRANFAGRRLAAVAVGGVLAVGLAGCSSSDDDSDDVSTETSASSAEEPVSDETEASSEGEAEGSSETQGSEPAGEGGASPEWAAPVTTPGDKIGTIQGEGFTVDIYQVGVTQAPEDGLLVDPDTNKPVLAKGDDIVFVNYVVTNTSDQPVNLGSSLVDVIATYADWPYLQGMDSVTDSDLYEKMGVNEDGNAEYIESGVYPLGPSQQISYGTNFMYKTDVPVEFGANLAPVDDNGERLSGQEKEALIQLTLS